MQHANSFHMARGLSDCGAWAQYLCVRLVAALHVGPWFPQPGIGLQSLHCRSDSQPLDTREAPILLFLIFGKMYLFSFYSWSACLKAYLFYCFYFFKESAFGFTFSVLFSVFIFPHFVFNNFCPYLYYSFSSAYFGFNFLCSIQHTDS